MLPVFTSICHPPPQACLPIIDDLSRSAMRARHWKQLLRVTGGAVQISNEGLTRMTLGQLLELGLHSESYCLSTNSDQEPVA